MKIKVDISEERITELVENEIVKHILNSDYRGVQYGVREGIDKGVKNYIYKNKEVIIDKVVERASKEIVRKGIPKLLNEIGKGV